MFSPERDTKLTDWVIQGFNYNRENETINIFIREFLVDSKGEPDIPPTFLGLTFKKFGGEWKIISLGFDV